MTAAPDLTQRTIMLGRMASFTDAERLELWRCLIEDLYRHGYTVDGIGQCLARNVERIYNLGAVRKGGAR